jgi:hypothetical protein
MQNEIVAALQRRSLASVRAPERLRILNETFTLKREVRRERGDQTAGKLGMRTMNKLIGVALAAGATVAGAGAANAEVTATVALTSD